MPVTWRDRRYQWRRSRLCHQFCSSHITRFTDLLIREPDYMSHGRRINTGYPQKFIISRYRATVYVFRWVASRVRRRRRRVSFALQTSSLAYTPRGHPTAPRTLNPRSAVHSTHANRSISLHIVVWQHVQIDLSQHGKEQWNFVTVISANSDCVL